MLLLLVNCIFPAFLLDFSSTIQTLLLLKQIDAYCPILRITYTFILSSLKKRKRKGCAEKCLNQQFLLYNRVQKKIFYCNILAALAVIKTKHVC